MRCWLHARGFGQPRHHCRPAPNERQPCERAAVAELIGRGGGLVLVDDSMSGSPGVVVAGAMHDEDVND